MYYKFTDWNQLVLKWQMHSNEFNKKTGQVLTGFKIIFLPINLK